MNPSTVLIIAMVCVTAGYLAGIAVSKLSSGRTQVRKAVPKPVKEQPGRQPVAQISRDGTGGSLVIQVGGKDFRSAGDMSSSTRQEIEELTIEIHKWLGYRPAASDAKPAEAMPAPKPPPAPATQSPLKLVALPIVPKASPPKPLPKSIVEQIDEILQANLHGTAFAEQHVSLKETPNGGVAVEVGLQRYDSIESVPDDQVRSLIRAAVAEWELVAK